MSKTDSVKPTTAVKEWAQLADTGLKEHNIQFELSQPCHERILQAFPKLSRVGYELLLFQRGEGGGFCNFAGPYTLKDASAHSKIYIRPLQKDLEVDEVYGPEEEVSVLLNITRNVCNLKTPLLLQTKFAQCSIALN